MASRSSMLSAWMILTGVVCRLQICRSIIAQWFDSTFRANREIHFCFYLFSSILESKSVHQSIKSIIYIYFAIHVWFMCRVWCQCHVWMFAVWSLWGAYTETLHPSISGSWPCPCSCSCSCLCLHSQSESESQPKWMQSGVSLFLCDSKHQYIQQLIAIHNESMTFISNIGIPSPSTDHITERAHRCLHFESEFKSKFKCRNSEISHHINTWNSWKWHKMQEGRGF